MWMEKGLAATVLLTRGLTQSLWTGSHVENRHVLELQRNPDINY